MGKDSFIKDFYRRHTILSHLLLVGCVCVFLCFFTLFLIDVWTNHGKTTVVPEVRKMSFYQAVDELHKSHLKYEISDSVYDNNSAPGTVNEIWPHPGTHVKPGRVIYLTVNSFQPQNITISMPLAGVSSRQALTYLESLGIRNVRIVYVPSSFPDLVEGAKYKGKSLKPGMQIPVNADVVLEVGTVTKSMQAPEESTPAFDRELPDESNRETDIPDHEQTATDANTDQPQPVADPDVFD